MRYPKPFEGNGSNIYLSSYVDGTERFFALGMYIHRPGTPHHTRRVTAKMTFAELTKLFNTIHHQLSLDAAEPSDNCRPNGDPIFCGAEFRIDKSDEFSETQCCVLAQGHVPKFHKTRTGKLFV